MIVIGRSKFVKENIDKIADMIVNEEEEKG
jgi:hypothetical protein